MARQIPRTPQAMPNEPQLTFLKTGRSRAWTVTSKKQVASPCHVLLSQGEWGNEHGSCHTEVALGVMGDCSMSPLFDFSKPVGLQVTVRPGLMHRYAGFREALGIQSEDRN